MKELKTCKMNSSGYSNTGPTISKALGYEI